MHQNALANVMGNFSWSERVLQIRYTICCHDLSRFELLVLLSSLLPNPQLESSVLSVCMNPVGTLYAIPYRLTSVVCTRVSNELGAGNPEGARLSIVSVMFIAVAETVVLGRDPFGCCKGLWVAAYRSIYQSCLILSLWNLHFCLVLAKLERKRREEEIRNKHGGGVAIEKERGRELWRDGRRFGWR
nr:protein DETOXIFICATION 12-like [Ipomoea batatas]